ncbi:hypothetical protein GQ44DRAFT_701607 [Phaeosphaeriaceae sp. PMI808]|nr:hypothetical protein GQ44DRAFT_720841 [Phaeosphaeriaceae sp. PMI808]KAH8728551.1 hypothetical protein GQ44DRAFT_701607 [Phaeosphaeriaceae sp. PMI808]
MHSSIILSSIGFVCHALAMASAPVEIMFPQGSGPFRSRLSVAELIDSSTSDPWNASHPRRTMISRFDPVPRAECESLIRVPYLTPAVAATQNEYIGLQGWPPILDPAQSGYEFFLEVCPGSSIYGNGSNNALEPLPKMSTQGTGQGRKVPILAVFSPGLNTTRLLWSNMAQELASHGITVITIDHPYDTNVVEFLPYSSSVPDIIYGGRIDLPSYEPPYNWSSFEKGVEVRVRDVTFLLDTLQVPHPQADEGNDQADVVMLGHSYGGGTTATAILRDDRIRAGANIDGAMFGGAVTQGLGGGLAPGDPNPPYILWGHEGHNTSSTVADDGMWMRFWPLITTNSTTPPGYVREVTLRPSRHNSYVDLNVLVDLVPGLRARIAALQSALASNQIGPDSLAGLRVYAALGKHLGSFFQFATGRAAESEFWKKEGFSDSEFLEVEILRTG